MIAGERRRITSRVRVTVEVTWMERFLENMLTYVSREKPTQHITTVLERYRHPRPSVFMGRTCDDPSSTKYWLKQMEKLLQHFQCNEEEKVRCAIYTLEEEAGC